MKNSKPRNGRKDKYIYRTRYGFKVSIDNKYYGHFKTEEQAKLILINMTTEQKIREEFPEFNFTETQIEVLVSSVQEQEEDEAIFDGDWEEIDL